MEKPAARQQWATASPAPGSASLRTYGALTPRQSNTPGNVARCLAAGVKLPECRARQTADLYFHRSGFRRSPDIALKKKQPPREATSPSLLHTLPSIVTVHSETMAKDMTLLWGNGSPPCWRIMIALEEKNLQGYNQKQLNFEKMEHKSQEVLDINPRGELPAFKHGDRILNESFGACIYLENQFKSQGNKLIPDNPDEQALMYQRMFEVLTLYRKTVYAVAYNFLVPEGERHDSALKRHKEALTTELKLWEGYLQKAPDCFLVGKTFTLADVVFFPSAAFLFNFGLSRERYPKLAAYYNCLKDRPSIKATSAFDTPESSDPLKDI